MATSDPSSLERRLSSLMIAARADASRETSQLMREAAIWLHRYYRHRLPREHREDLVQDTLLALHNQRMTWDASRPFLPWLAGIARYGWLNHLRHVYRHRQHHVSNVDILAIEDGRVADHELHALASASIDKLFMHIPERQAKAIRLVKINGYSVREAASLTGQSESLVKVNIHRGMRKLVTLAAHAA